MSQQGYTVTCHGHKSHSQQWKGIKDFSIIMSYNILKHILTLRQTHSYLG